MDGEWLSLEVNDNGKGISQEILVHTRSLGVMGMMERARMAGGELIIGANGERGASVRVRLPFETSRNTGSGRSMIRVLIADDHPIVRKGLRELVAGEARHDRRGRNRTMASKS